MAVRRKESIHDSLVDALRIGHEGGRYRVESRELPVAVDDPRGVIRGVQHELAYNRAPVIDAEGRLDSRVARLHRRQKRKKSVLEQEPLPVGSAHHHAVDVDTVAIG